MTERERFEKWCAAGGWKATESMWAAWEARAGLVPEASFIEKLKGLKRGHDYCEDPWYSCPLAEDGCADDRKGPGCECGADAHNAKVDALIAACSPQERQS